MKNDAAIGISKWVQPASSEASPIRSLCETLIPSLLLGIQVKLTPLGHPYFPYVAGILCAATIGYAIYGLLRLPQSSQRWQLLPPRSYDGDELAFGCMFIGTFFLAGLIPIVVIKAFDFSLPRPAGGAWAYLLWCLVQDFIFFSLILRGLTDLVHPFLAISVSAILFGISHYPNLQMVAVTMFAGGAWGYLFLAARWLPLVTLSHWVMGLTLLM
jgi:membrane protease YdiL (CAAX protease family)